MKCLGVEHRQWSFMANVWLIKTQHKGIKCKLQSHVNISLPLTLGWPEVRNWVKERWVMLEDTHSHMQMQLLGDLDKMSVFSHFFIVNKNLLHLPYLLHRCPLSFLFSASCHLDRDFWVHYPLTLGRHPKTEGHCRVISQNLCLCVHPPIFPQGPEPNQKWATERCFSPDAPTKSIVLYHCVTWVQSLKSKGRVSETEMDRWLEFLVTLMKWDLSLCCSKYTGVTSLQATIPGRAFAETWKERQSVWGWREDIR